MMGYLLNDNRASGGACDEYDTVACKHCRRAMVKVRNATSGYFCFPCGGPICEPCAATKVCTPFLAKIERALGRQALADAMGLQKGG